MSDGFTFKLDYPLTQEQIDVITDAELEHTSKIWFKTRSGKEVEFVKAQRWIPCSERLPETADIVLVTNKWHKLDFLYYRPDKGWHHGNMQDTEGKPSVIAWMPLPEPYKERK